MHSELFHPYSLSSFPASVGTGVLFHFYLTEIHVNKDRVHPDQMLLYAACHLKHTQLEVS